jgi:hypothetical protein
MVYLNDISHKSNTKRKGESLLLSDDNNGAKMGTWSQRFMVSAILQGLLIIVLTSSGIAMQMIYSSTINIVQFISLSFDGPAKWIFLGYIFYMVLIALMATTATFYNHLEVNLQKRIRGMKSFLAWINLVGVNAGGSALAMTIIYAGLVGSGIFDVIISGSAAAAAAAANIKENTAVMDDFIPTISVFAGILITGAVSGSVLYLATCFQNAQHHMGKCSNQGGQIH